MSESKVKAVDIGRQQIAGVYAKSLLAAAESAGETVDVIAQLGEFCERVLEPQEKFRSMLESSRVAVEDKTALLDKVLKGRMTDILLRFLKVVAEHGRLDCLDDIYCEARRQFHESQGIAQVEIVTAVAVDDKAVGGIRESLKQRFGQQLELALRVDPELIGGIVVKIGDKLYDGSVANRLQSLRESAVANAVKKMRDATDRLVEGD